MSTDSPHDHPEPARPAPLPEAHAHPMTATTAVPEAEPVVDEDVDAHAPVVGPAPVPASLASRVVPRPELPLTIGPLCKINLKPGCYRITFRPSVLVTYQGTLRVEVSGGSKVISGDLYRFTNLIGPLGTLGTATLERGDEEGDGGAPDSHVVAPAPVTAARLSELTAGRLVWPRPLPIPIYPRKNYYSYLKVTGVTQSPPFGGDCTLTLTAQEYVYTHPAAGSFDGTFPASPGTRTVTIEVSPAPAPAGFPGPYFAGRLREGAVDKGSFTMGWVSSFVRRAVLEIDTLKGSVAPGPVGGEDFGTVFKTAGWLLSVVRDQVDVPVPAGVTPTSCWSSGNLHNLMTTVRKATTDLDKEWRMHLIVVPAALGCGRGVMYDQIGVPREGVASFSDDGYPSSDTTHYDGAVNKKQRDVPRAFLRSACHEVGHGFNQIHQEGEGGADNSIMTTTPSVAGVIGAAGTFPDDINLSFNAHVRRHLMHWPDPLVRPGGHTFGAGHGGPTVPSADRVLFGPDELDLAIDPVPPVALGEPVRLSWTLTNTAAVPIAVPNDIGIEAQHARLAVTAPGGSPRNVRSFVIRTDAVTMEPLPPGASLAGRTRVFWSTDGFAFPTPGRHRLDLEVSWAQADITFAVRATTEVWVDFPQNPADNDAAAALLHDEVGMYVALGGDAPHLTEATERLRRVTAMAGNGAGDDAGSGPAALRGFEGILPEGTRS